MTLATTSRPATARELITGCECLYFGPGISRRPIEGKRGVIVDEPETDANGTATFAVRVGIGSNAKCYWGYLGQFEIEEPELSLAHA